MALISPDLSEVTGPIPAGQYSVRVIKDELKESKAGNKYVAWSFEVFEAANADFNGKLITHRTPINGKGAFLLQNLYKAAVGEKLEGQFDTQQIVGKELTIVLTDVDRHGKALDWPEVKTVAALG